jgi:hypothetical protein
MGASVTFDTLGNFEKLKAAGFSEAQARAQAEALREIIEDRLVTKQFLDLRLAELRADLIKWVAGMLAAQAAVVAALVKLL